MSKVSKIDLIKELHKNQGAPITDNFVKPFENTPKPVTVNIQEKKEATIEIVKAKLPETRVIQTPVLKPVEVKPITPVLLNTLTVNKTGIPIQVTKVKPPEQPKSVPEVKVMTTLTPAAEAAVARTVTATKAEIRKILYDPRVIGNIKATLKNERQAEAEKMGDFLEKQRILSSNFDADHYRITNGNFFWDVYKDQGQNIEDLNVLPKEASQETILNYLTSLLLFAPANVYSFVTNDTLEDISETGEIYIPDNILEEIILENIERVTIALVNYTPQQTQVFVLEYFVENSRDILCEDEYIPVIPVLLNALNGSQLSIMQEEFKKEFELQIRNLPAYSKEDASMRISKFIEQYVHQDIDSVDKFSELDEEECTKATLTLFTTDELLDSFVELLSSQSDDNEVSEEVIAVAPEEIVDEIVENVLSRTLDTDKEYVVEEINDTTELLKQSLGITDGEDGEDGEETVNEVEEETEDDITELLESALKEEVKVKKEITEADLYADDEEINEEYEEEEIELVVTENAEDNLLEDITEIVEEIVEEDTIPEEEKLLEVLLKAPPSEIAIKASAPVDSVGSIIKQSQTPYPLQIYLTSGSNVVICTYSGRYKEVVSYETMLNALYKIAKENEEHIVNDYQEIYNSPYAYIKEYNRVHNIDVLNKICKGMPKKTFIDVNTLENTPYEEIKIIVETLIENYLK
jgi:hypothetical protein